jgi:UPF0755 protein
MNRRTLIIAALVVLALMALVGGIGAWIIWGPNTQSVTEDRGVKIPPGSSFEVIVDSLDASGVLASSTTFRLVARATGWGGQIKAGYYEIPGGSSNYAMLSRLRRGLQSPIRITIPPGTTPQVVAAVTANRMHFDREEMEAVLRDAEFAAELGTDTTALFGYLMPETYDFFWLTPPRTVVRRIKQYFDQFYDRELAQGAEALNLSKQDVVTMASIVEWETHVNEERPKVAGVYLNRLRINMPLQADPTVQYAVMAREGQKRRLLFEDYRISHPFNTYQIAGLPPGPITNPSPASLRATVNPDDHDYLYFVATGDGGHVFSRTFREHVNAANRYRQLMQQRRAEQQQRLQAEPSE